MAELKVVNMAGAEVGTMSLSDAVFASEIHASVLHAAVKAYLGNQRQGTQSTLTRTEVSGGSRRVPAAQDRVPPELLSGRTAALRSVRSRVSTRPRSTRRFAVSL